MNGDITQYVSFVLALLPLAIILIGITIFKQSGLRMAIVGWISTGALAVAYFKTNTMVVLMGSLYGFLKGLGVSIAVVVTMYMIFIMKETGAVKSVSDFIKGLVIGRETQAIYIGIGFGSFLTCLGVVTPAMFPPILVAIGFSPVAAVSAAVLGYNATTSFGILSIPITLPAEAFGFDPLSFTFRICLFLPVITTALAFALLWIVGGKESMKKGMAPAFIAGLALAIACLAFSGINSFFNKEYVPVKVIGVFASLFAMFCIQIYGRIESARTRALPEYEIKSRKGTVSGMPLWRAVSPWLILMVLALFASIHSIGTFLAKLAGGLEVFHFYKNKSVDLDVLSQTYTLILAAVLISFLFLKPSRRQFIDASMTWVKLAWVPFLAYSIYFCIAFVMDFSAMESVGGTLVARKDFGAFNMNNILGVALGSLFGRAYTFFAPVLGTIGSVIGGSETTSNVMFYKIQETAAAGAGLAKGAFMILFASHAVAGGVASAITPAKINTAVVTLDESSTMESLIMKKHILIALVLTILISLLTALFVVLAI
jgi:lactate permease